MSEVNSKNSIYVYYLYVYSTNNYDVIKGDGIILTYPFDLPCCSDMFTRFLALSAGQSTALVIIERLIDPQLKLVHILTQDGAIVHSTSRTLTGIELLQVRSIIQG